jgi:hypothetical protein
LLSAMKSSRHSGNSVDCPRSAPTTKRFMKFPRKIARRIIAAITFSRSQGHPRQSISVSVTDGLPSSADAPLQAGNWRGVSRPDSYSAANAPTDRPGSERSVTLCFPDSRRHRLPRQILGGNATIHLGDHAPRKRSKVQIDPHHQDDEAQRARVGRRAIAHGLPESLARFGQAVGDPVEMLSGGDEHAGGVDPVNAGDNVASRVLLLSRCHQRLGIGAFDADEEREEIRLRHHPQELVVVGEVD